MKDNYSKSITLRCITCGDSDFEFNEDKSWIKCNRCGKEYLGGYNELVDLNQQVIKEELGQSAKKEMEEVLKKVFKGKKNIKFK